MYLLSFCIFFWHKSCLPEHSVQLNYSSFLSLGPQEASKGKADSNHVTQIFSGEMKWLKHSRTEHKHSRIEHAQFTYSHMQADGQWVSSYSEKWSFSMISKQSDCRYESPEKSTVTVELRDKMWCNRIIPRIIPRTPLDTSAGIAFVVCVLYFSSFLQFAF